MDLNKLPTDTAIDVLKWCKKTGIQWAQVAELLEIIKKKPQQSNGESTKKPSSRSKEPGYNYLKIRKDKGLTMETVCKEVPIQFKTLHKIEKGGIARADTLKRLNTFYGLE